MQEGTHVVAGVCILTQKNFPKNREVLITIFIVKSNSWIQNVFTPIIIYCNSQQAYYI